MNGDKHRRFVVDLVKQMIERNNEIYGILSSVQHGPREKPEWIDSEMEKIDKILSEQNKWMYNIKDLD